MRMGFDKEPLLLNEDDVERGGREGNESIASDFAYKNNVANAAVQVRMGFIRKVYSLLAVQLALTVILSSVGLFIPQVKSIISENDWLVLFAFFGTFGNLLALFIYRRKHPHNLILLTSFTVCESVMLGVIIAQYNTMVVLEAVFLTFAVVAALTCYTFQTKRDFTGMGAGLSAALVVLLLGGFLNLFLGGSAMDLLLAIAGALLFCLFIIYDTQMLMKTLSPEEYILATISLYLDIINLFLHILRILSEASRQ